MNSTRRGARSAINANEITNRLLVTIPERLPNVRVWRRNVGGGYPAAVVRTALGLLRRGQVQTAIDCLSRARIVHFGLPGEPDIDGLAGPDGRRIGIEVKAADDKQSTVQEICQEVYQRHGAVYLIAEEDVESAIEQLADRLRTATGK